MSGGEFDEPVESLRCNWRSFTAGPCRGLDHGGLVIEESEPQGFCDLDRQWVIDTAVPASGLLAGPAPNAGVVVGECCEQFVTFEVTESVECSQRRGTDLGFAAAEQAPGSVTITDMSGDGGTTSLGDRLGGSTRHWEH